MNVEANPKRMLITRLNLKGFVGLTRQFFGNGKIPKSVLISSFELVLFISSSSDYSFSSAPLRDGASDATDFSSCVSCGFSRVEEVAPSSTGAEMFRWMSGSVIAFRFAHCGKSPCQDGTREILGFGLTQAAKMAR